MTYSLDALSTCSKCALSTNRTQVVIYSGDTSSKIMLVGECPGPDEDKRGVPFIGKAGQMLRHVLSSIGVEPDRVFITNLVKCFPHSSLNPSEEHIKMCSPYLSEQINTMRPNLIVSLGKLSSEFFIGGKIKITQESGKIRSYGSTHLLPVVHPSYVIRGYKSPSSFAMDLLPILEFLP